MGINVLFDRCQCQKATYQTLTNASTRACCVTNQRDGIPPLAMCIALHIYCVCMYMCVCRIESGWRGLAISVWWRNGTVWHDQSHWGLCLSRVRVQSPWRPFIIVIIIDRTIASSIREVTSCDIDDCMSLNEQSCTNDDCESFADIHR